MASDKITEIVDQSAFAQVDKLKLDLKALTDQFVQLFGGVEQFKKALAGASTSGGLSGGINSTTKSLTALEKATQQQIELANRLRVAEHSVFQERELAKQQNAELNKQNALHVKMVNAEVGSYDEMQAKLSQLTMKYKAMGAAQREAMGKDTLANIQKYEKGLQDIDKTMGKFNRNVGNYQNQTFQLSQVFREIPAFTYSATTGILALSNNLPMLADGFKQVATATNDATGKVNGTMGALKIFAKSIFSWTNAFTIAIGLITIFSKEITDFISGTESAADAADKFTNSLEGMRQGLQQIRDDIAFNNDMIDKETKLLIAKAKASGNDEEARRLSLNAEKKGIQEKIDLLNFEMKKIQENRSLYNDRLRIKNVNASAIPQSKEDLQKLLDETDSLYSESMKKRSDLLIDLKIKELEYVKPDKDKKDKEINRVKELENEFENELKIQKTAFNNEEMGLIIHLNKMLDITQKYSEKLKGIKSLSKNEAESAIDFKLKASDVAKDALDDIREQVLTQMKVPKSKADKIVGKAITIPVDVEVEIKINDKDITSLQDVIDTLKKIQSVADDIGGAVSDINQLYFEREMSNLDVKDKRLKEYYDNELRFIEQSGFSEARKQKDKQRLEAETAAKQRKIEIDRITAMRKAARIQKAIDLAQAIQTTAIAVITAFKEGDAYTKAARALIAAGIGAASIARIAATPLPQYAKGTDYHKGGSFIAGEKGVEQVILPSGKSFLTPDSATLFPDMPQGTKVINNKDLMQQVYNSAIVKLSTQGQVTPQKMMEAQMMAFEEMTDEVKGLRHDLRAKELTATFQDYAGFRNYKNSNIR